MRIDGIEERIFRDAEGMIYGPQEAEDMLERWQRDIDRFRSQLTRDLDGPTRRGVERRIARWERLHDSLWQQLHPVLQDDVGLVNARIGAGEVQACRVEECPNGLTKKRAFEQMGMCDTCWQLATTVHATREGITE